MIPARWDGEEGPAPAPALVDLVRRERGQLAPRRRVQGAQVLVARLFAGQDRLRLSWRSWL
ncbi:MAG: hypothetical protein JOZ69_07090, partial [Myxococcales bacterium]|nr:hypothetical protein [Myxococcales bacterium]